MTESAAAVRGRHVGRLALTGVLYAGLYWGAAALAWREPVVLVPGAMDAVIPFTPVAIWFYLSEFVMIAAAFWHSDSPARVELLDALTITIVAAASAFVLVPTVVPRGAGDFSGLTGVAWHALYALDTQRNALPSMHAAVAVPCMAALWRRGGAWRAIGPFWGLVVLLSALATKQHFLTDLFAGLILGVLAQGLARRRKHDRRRAGTRQA